MPELPEVETVARELRDLIIGKEINDIQSIWHKSFDNRSSVCLEGQAVKEIGRKGKYLSIQLNKSALIVHLRMTGQLLFKLNHNDNCDTHIRAKILFKDNSAIYFKDTRKFGRIYHVDDPDDILYKIGIDAIDPILDEGLFKEMLARSNCNIKSFLLAQDKIAGVGNIYADESLFRSEIHPISRTNKIPSKKASNLHNHLIDILHTAIQNMGSTISDYRDSYGNSGNNQKFLNVYQRTNEPCIKCSTPISKLRISGRGTHFCTKCQKIYK